MIEIRELLVSEVPAEAGVPAGALVIGVVQEGRVIAVLAAFTTVFIDPLWVVPELRTKSVSFLRPLWEKLRARLQRAGIHYAFGHADQSNPSMPSLLKRLGGREVEGKRQFVLSLFRKE